MPVIERFPSGPVVKNPPANAGDARDMGSISESGRFPGGGSDNPLHYSCLENSMDRGGWQATVHGITKESDMTLLLSTHTHHWKLSRWGGEQCECCYKTGKG